MKKVMLSTLMATSLVMAYNEDISDSESHTYIVNQNIVNDVIASPTVSAQTTQKSTQSKPSGSAAGQYIYSEKINIINIPLSYNVGDSFSIIGALPIVSTNNELGMGDISLGATYQFGGINDTAGYNVTTLRYKSTTGDDKKGTGSGADAISLSHNFSKDFVSGFYVNAIFSYTSNYSDYTNEFGAKVSYGDAFLVALGGAHECLFSDKVMTSAKVTYFHNDDHDYNANKFGKTTNVDFWLEWTSTSLVPTLPLARSVPIAAGIKIPLVNEVNNVEQSKVFQFYISIAGLY